MKLKANEVLICILFFGSLGSVLFYFIGSLTPNIGFSIVLILPLAHIISIIMGLSFLKHKNPQKIPFWLRIIVGFFISLLASVLIVLFFRSNLFGETTLNEGLMFVFQWTIVGLILTVIISGLFYWEKNK